MHEVESATPASRVVVIVAIVLAFSGIAFPALADASTRTANFDYFCTAKECAHTAAALEPPGGPTFNPTPPPTITTFPVQLTYDPSAGVLSYSQGMPDTTYAFAGPDYCSTDPYESECDDNGLQVAAIWANLGTFKLSHGADTPGPSSSTVVTFDNPDGGLSDASADWNSAGQEVVTTDYEPVLRETGVSGGLKPTSTISGNEITFTWSSPYLRNLGLTEYSASTGGQFLNFGPSYFAGYDYVPPPVEVPTGFNSPTVKPATMTVTGDGSSFFGGRTGHAVTGGPHRRADLGRLRWGSYKQTTATATGVDWSKFGPGPLAADRFRIDATVKLLFSTPTNGIFTRMTVTMHFNGHAYGPLKGKTRIYRFKTAEGGDMWTEQSP
jgi:hypothetical protein